MDTTWICFSNDFYFHTQDICYTQDLQKKQEKQKYKRSKKIYKRSKNIKEAHIKEARQEKRQTF